MDQRDKSRIAQEVLNYLARHPEAQDTLEGISEWWLLEEKIKRRTSEIREVVADLVRHGLLVEYAGRDARAHYRLKRPREAQAEAGPFRGPGEPEGQT